MSEHSMTTRYKKSNQPPSDIDDQGNITDLIDYDCDEALDKNELYNEISRLSNGRINMELSPKNKHKITIEEIDPCSTPTKKSDKSIKFYQFIREEFVKNSFPNFKASPSSLQRRTYHIRQQTQRKWLVEL